MKGKAIGTQLFAKKVMPFRERFLRMPAIGPELVRALAAGIPKSQYVQFAGSAHITNWDAREENVKVVGDLLRLAERCS